MVLLLSHIRVYPLDPLSHKGILLAGKHSFPCALGKNGVTDNKHEGDQKTPLGCFQMQRGFFREDRISLPSMRFPFVAIKLQDGWCDAPESPLYNQPISLPFSESHEIMWREDSIYDIVIDIGYNRDPIEKGAGSAVFFHLVREGFLPTRGCVAIEREAMLVLLPLITRNTIFEVLREKP